MCQRKIILILGSIQIWIPSWLPLHKVKTYQFGTGKFSLYVMVMFLIDFSTYETRFW